MAADINGDQLKVELVEMDQGVNYNIPKNVWHNIALLENTRVLIIENENTHLGDYEFFHLSEVQILKLHHDVNLLLMNKL